MKTISISIVVFLFCFLTGEYFPDRTDHSITIENSMVEVTDLTDVEESH